MAWYRRRAVRDLGRTRLLAAGTSVAALLALTAAGCGGNQRQDANEPSGNFPIQVVRATFPNSQRLAQKSQLQIAVRNAGRKTAPNVAVSVLSGEANAPAAATAFEEASTEPGLADPSRPVWVLDRGPIGGVTAYTNTWALGALRPGQTRTFVWHVTAVRGGVHSIKYKIAAGLNGKAKAVVPGSDQEPAGQFTIRISNKPADARVGDNGQVITTPRQ
jgi:hypothetical protein